MENQILHDLAIKVSSDYNNLPLGDYVSPNGEYLIQNIANITSGYGSNDEILTTSRSQKKGQVVIIQLNQKVLKSNPNFNNQPFIYCSIFFGEAIAVDPDNMWATADLKSLELTILNNRLLNYQVKSVIDGMFDMLALAPTQMNKDRAKNLVLCLDKINKQVFKAKD